MNRNIIKKVATTFMICALAHNAYSQNIAEGGPQFENYGFEEWALYDPNDERSNEPVNWHAWMSAYGEYNSLQNAKYQQIWPSSNVRPGSSGDVSVKITARDVLGVLTANGGITNGRIHVGSNSVNDTTNFNITLRDQETFHTPLGAYPDSLSIWVAFACEYQNQYARIRAIVHGDADFSERADASFNLPEMYCGQALQTFPRTNAIYDTLNYNWTRLSIPFVYDGPCDNPEYVLFTLGTNQYPGQGLGNEFIILDDILLIYNPTLQIGDFNTTRIALTGSDVPVDIPYIIEGTMSPSNINADKNIVTAQLSDKNGNFDNAINIGSIQSDVSGIIEAAIPSNTPFGDGYRIRVTSTNYPLISDDNGFDIIIDSTLNINTYSSEIRLYPTIATNVLNIDCKEDIKNITIYNQHGQIVKDINTSSSARPIKIDIENLQKGMYHIIATTPSEKKSFKFIKL